MGFNGRRKKKPKKKKKKKRGENKRGSLALRTAGEESVGRLGRQEKRVPDSLDGRQEGRK
jgi:hypothetical protein